MDEWKEQEPRIYYYSKLYNLRPPKQTACATQPPCRKGCEPAKGWWRYRDGKEKESEVSSQKKPDKLERRVEQRRCCM